MLKIYGIKNCDTMKKSFQWLNENEITYEFHDYKKLGIEASDIKKWAGQIEFKLLINRKGATFKKLSAAQQTACEKMETAIPLMQEFTSMIKRPILENNKGLLVGFEPEAWTKVLL
ncbi:MAG: Spx/MgsR family RNA polymerase-binding regulatory protein [bacterium]|nr:Spx/MgsR family RNA polymerase-binding regulatory protein [bacterium]